VCTEVGSVDSDHLSVEIINYQFIGSYKVYLREYW
jgi:hypothetical protein